MKRILIMSLCFLLFITGCMQTTYSLQQPRDSIERVEIVDISVDMYNDSSEYSVVKVLSFEEEESLLKELETITFKNYIGDPAAASGRSVRICYYDGSYEIICFFSCEYIKDGLVTYIRRGCDESQFSALLDMFLSE